jgi:putative endonuclease
MPKQAYVYIMANDSQTVLYTGVTSNLVQRVWQHKRGTVPGFTLRYRVKRLVYYEIADDIRSAISREKQIKGGSREAKLKLIRSMNPDWRDLSKSL